MLSGGLSRKFRNYWRVAAQPSHAGPLCTRAPTGVTLTAVAWFPRVACCCGIRRLEVVWWSFVEAAACAAWAASRGAPPWADAERRQRTPTAVVNIMATSAHPLTSVFWTVLLETAGVKPTGREAFSARGVDKTIIKRATTADLAERSAEYGDGPDAADSVLAIGEFERKLADRKARPARKRAQLVDSHSWSKDVAGLLHLIEEEAVPAGTYSKYKTRTYLQSHFTEWKLPNVKIDELDAGIEAFTGLKELYLSGNELRVIDHVPPSLMSLNVYCNHVERVDLPKPAASVVNLGAGYNYIDHEGLCSVVRSFPRLRVLDLTCNSLTNLNATLDELEKLEDLSVLCLSGNALALQVGYRTAIMKRFPNMTHLDDIEITEEHREALAEAEEAAKKTADGVDGASAAGASEGGDAAGAGAAPATTDAAADAGDASAPGSSAASAIEPEAPPVGTGELSATGLPCMRIRVNIPQVVGMLTPAALAPQDEEAEDPKAAKGKKAAKSKKPAKGKKGKPDPEPEEEGEAPKKEDPLYFLRYTLLEGSPPIVSRQVKLGSELGIHHSRIIELPVTIPLREFVQFGRLQLEVCEQPPPPLPEAPQPPAEGDDGAGGGEGNGEREDGVAHDGAGDGGPAAAGVSVSRPATPAEPIVLATAAVRLEPLLKPTRKPSATVMQPVTFKALELPSPAIDAIDKKVTAKEKAAAEEEREKKEADGEEVVEPTEEELKAKQAAHKKAVRDERRSVREGVQVKCDVEVTAQFDLLEPLVTSTPPPPPKEDDA